jgi:uncharacterized membrane protein YphA (DoxX/SURF4 family)
MNHVHTAKAPSSIHRALTFLRPGIGNPSRATLLVRLALGGVFVSSGLIKFLFANQGPGRFTKLGFPAASELSHFVGGVEISCGLLLALGLCVRLAALPLVIDMLVAIVTTKLPLLVGPGPEPVAALPRPGSGHSLTKLGSMSRC